MPAEYMVFEDSSKQGRFFPWFRYEGTITWQYFLVLRTRVSYETEEEAQTFVDSKPIEHGWSNDEE